MSEFWASRRIRGSARRPHPPLQANDVVNTIAVSPIGAHSHKAHTTPRRGDRQGAPAKPRTAAQDGRCAAQTSGQVLACDAGNGHCIRAVSCLDCLNAASHLRTSGPCCNLGPFACTVACVGRGVRGRDGRWFGFRFGSLTVLRLGIQCRFGIGAVAAGLYAGLAAVCV